MQISHVQTFLVVLETGNLNRAAEWLNVTQSTVTTRINSLEAALGQKLLVRNRSGTQLTAAGFKFQRHGELMVESWRQAQLETALPSGFTTSCNIACHHDAWYGGGEFLCEILTNDHPGVAIALWPGESNEIRRWLASGMVDVAVLFEINRQDGSGCLKLFEDQLVQVSNEARAVMHWDPKYVYVDHGPEYRRQHAAAFQTEETATVSFGSSDWALKHLLAAGGSAYLPARLVQGLVSDSVLHLVESAPTFHRTCNIVHNSAVTSEWNWFADWIAASRNRISKSLQY